MKFEKTYRDFITEAKLGILKDNSNSFGKTFIKDLEDAVKETKEKKERMLRQMPDLLTTYAKAFLIVYNDQSIWNDFITNLIKQNGGKNQFTKFQFMSYFFKYYIAEVMNNNVGTIRKTLIEASQSLEIEKEQYKKSKIKNVKKIVNGADKYKNIFIKVFKAMSRGW